MVEIDKKRSFRYNLEAGCSKDDMMKYYCIKTEAEWHKRMESIKMTKLQQDAKNTGAL